MLDRDRVECAVRLHALGYRLLQWLEGALRKGFVAPEAAGRYATSEECAHAWLERHYLNLPVAVRPERTELRAFASLFSTYLRCTFDLDARPGARLHSEDAHCFCPFCSWLVRKPHLRPKRVGVADKKVAERMERDFLRRLAASRGVTAPDSSIEELFGDKELREPIGLCAYAADLVERLEGRAAGPAALVLWRRFAWTAKGSPKRGFVLRSAAILSAQEELARRLSGSGGVG